MILERCSSAIGGLGLHIHGKPRRYAQGVVTTASSTGNFLCLFSGGRGSTLRLTSSAIPPPNPKPLLRPLSSFIQAILLLCGPNFGSPLSARRACHSSLASVKAILIRHSPVCGYSSSTFLASETPLPFMVRPTPRHHQRRTRSLVVCADKAGIENGFTNYRPQSFTCRPPRWRFSCLPDDSRLPDAIDIEALVHDEEWQKARREESKQLAKQRQLEAEAEAEKEAEYRKIGDQLKNFPEEKVAEARKFVASLIKSGEEVEEMIEKAAESGELTPIVLVVIRNRLELARHDDERHAIQALDLLYRRVEMEMLQREASMAMQLLNQLLNLHDGFSHDEWLRRCRATMLQVFVPEDAFTILGPPEFDLENHMGPLEIPEEDDALLRIDFMREVDELLLELEAEAQIKPISGFDAESVAVRLRQEEKIRAIQQVKDLRKLAATLKW